ncbi:helix-turn-helix domain-containing protein [Cyclobacterium sp.]|uniref:AraC family transcriptional regulator n=1 Tax=Cyclobacterium sp. TaxID=1966343 RepID=UPI001999F568|nr:helix-turn-helix domain-containing protein [Cyclobacterium sp.]MBD3630627.1 helix-turn-helix domain-containing protein [Cyclobacterium sp.]
MHKFFDLETMEGSFHLADGNDFKTTLKTTEHHLKFFWNFGAVPLILDIDGQPISLEPNELLSCTYLQKITVIEQQNQPEILFLAFNRGFYCIHTYDSEVSCNGLLFFGSNYNPVIQLDEEEIIRLRTLISVLQEEFDTKDQNQEEMLRLLLKRFIIRITRLARKQLFNKKLPEKELELVRQFNVLVEENFKTLRQVTDYAALMNRSPKTIANIFSQQGGKRPLEIIHDRLILEAKRLLLYTDQSSKEIGWELGFEDPSQFNRFFKTHMEIPPREFREKFVQFSF